MRDGEQYGTATLIRQEVHSRRIETVSVPRARPDSGFTLLFEALLMTMVSARLSCRYLLV